MTQETPPETTEKRKYFVAYISFQIPQAGPAQIAARDKDHARELLTEAHKNVLGFTIVDIFDADEIEQLAQATEGTDDEGTTVH